MKAITLKQAEKQHGLYHVVKDIKGDGYLYRLLAKEDDALGIASGYKKATDEKLMVMVICK
jgi:hypothetical protein